MGDYFSNVEFLISTALCNLQTSLFHKDHARLEQKPSEINIRESYVSRPLLETSWHF